MLHVGLDLSRRRLDFDLSCEDGSRIERGAAPPDADGLRGLVRRVDVYQEPVCAAIESMNGARFVHDRLEELGWQGELADAQKVKGLAPLACKTDRIDAWVLAELSRRDLVPAIWLPSPTVRQERERARWRLHLVRHRTALKNRVHATLIAFGKPCPVSDLFGSSGRQLLARLELPDPWSATVNASRALIEAAVHAVCSPVYRERYQRTATRLGRQRGKKVARVDIARKLAEAIWYMLTRSQPFAPAGATTPLAA